MSATLENLPAEILRVVVKDLTIKEICDLALKSKQLYDKLKTILDEIHGYILRDRFFKFTNKNIPLRYARKNIEENVREQIYERMIDTYYDNHDFGDFDADLAFYLSEILTKPPKKYRAQHYIMFEDYIKQQDIKLRNRDNTQKEQEWDASPLDELHYQMFLNGFRERYYILPDYMRRDIVLENDDDDDDSEEVIPRGEMERMFRNISRINPEYQDHLKSWKKLNAEWNESKAKCVA